MAGLLKDDFSTKRPITQVPAAWFNAVAKILNGITAGAGININKNGTDTAAWEFELDLEYAKKYLGIEDAEKPDDLTHEDITDWDTATADFLDGDDYDAIIEAIGDVADIVDGILADYLDSGDINVTVAAKNHTHTTANITDWATATADFLTDADMSNYALEADLLTLAEEVTGIEGDLLDLADAVEAIDADLALLELDVQDISDYLETCLTDDDLPAAFITAVASRKTLSDMKVITDLQWTGTALQYKSRSVSYSNGLLTVKGSESSWTTLDTPTVISWS